MIDRAERHRERAERAAEVHRVAVQPVARVPSSLAMSTMNAPSIAQCAGIVPPSNVMLCEPEPFRPIVWPQSSCISHTPRGA